MNKLKEYIPYILIILSIIAIRMYIITPVRVDGPSMNPTLKQGQILLLNKLDKNYERMDIVVFYHHGERLIKRVIGLPYETVSIKDNKLYINGILTDDYADVETKDYDLNVTIPKDYYFVLGDNRSNSLDSRALGLISKDKIVGSVRLRLLPPGIV